MLKQENALKLAAMQAKELMGLPAKNSRLVAFAMACSRLRKTVKKTLTTALRRLVTKRPVQTNALRVLVHIRGGIGDVAMARMFVKKLREKLPSAQLFFCYDSKAPVEMVFEDGGLINGFQDRHYIAQDYDLVISGCHVLMYDYYNKARIEKLAPDFLPILHKGLEMQTFLRVFAQNTPHLDGYLANATVAYGSTRIANMGLSTGLDVGQNDRVPLALQPAGFCVLEKLGLAGKKYITIHDGINVNTDTSSGFPTRCWPQANWRAFAQLCKARFPDILIVQLGGAKSRVFDFVDISLVGKTTIAELPYILEKALLHVDGESGMVQTANLTHTISLVVFGPTPADYFSYARNMNLISEKCNNCMCIVKDWMTHCALSYPEDQTCMAQVSARRVFEKAERFLAEKQAPSCQI